MAAKSDVSSKKTTKEKDLKEKPAKRVRTRSVKGSASDALYSVAFKVTDIPTNYGDNAYICGSSEALGNWDPESEAGKCDFLDYGTWTLKKEFKKGEHFEFKVVKKLLDGTIIWQEGENLSCTVSSDNQQICVQWKQI